LSEVFLLSLESALAQEGDVGITAGVCLDAHCDDQADHHLKRYIEPVTRWTENEAGVSNQDNRGKREVAECVKHILVAQQDQQAKA
jgi:hypothetical protein